MQSVLNKLKDTVDLRVLELGNSELFFGEKLLEFKNISYHLACFGDPASYSSWSEKAQTSKFEVLAGDFSRLRMGRGYHAVSFTGETISEVSIRLVEQALAPEGYLVLHLEKSLPKAMSEKLKNSFSEWNEEGKTIFAKKKPARELISQLPLENLELGHQVSFRHSFSQQDLEQFTELSGDVNPLHFDDSYAGHLGFKQRLVFGLLSAGLVSRLIGVDVPGMYSLIREMNISFPRPLYPDEEIEVEGRVHEIDIEKRLLAVKFDARRISDMKKVFRGKVMVSVPSPEKEWNLSFDQKVKA